MKSSLIFIFIFILWGCSHKNKENIVASDPQLDSIKEWITIAKSGTELSMVKRKLYLEKSQNEIDQLTNDTNRLQLLSSLSLAYQKLKDSLKFRETNSNTIEAADKGNFYEVLGNSHWDLAIFFESYAVLDSAFYHYQKALNNFDKLPAKHSLKSRGIVLYNMARIQNSYKDYLGAELSISEAIKIFDDFEDNLRLHNSYNVLGSIANGRNDIDKALEYYAKAENYLEGIELSTKQNLSWTNQNNIASALMRVGNYTDAKIAYENLLSDEELKIKNPKLYVKATSSLAYTLFKQNQNLEKIQYLLDEAKNINNENNDFQNLARLNQFYAELLAAKGDTAQALLLANESREIAKETYNNDRSLEVLKILADIDPVNAGRYFDEYADLNEVVQEEESTKRNKFARISLETDQVIEENQVLTEEKQMWAGAVFGLVVFGFAFISIVILYINNNRLKFKQKQQESNQEIYNLMLSQQGKFEEGKQLEQKRISEELHDGILGEMLGIRLILSGLNEREDMASVAQRADLIEKLRGVEEEIRTISHELNSAAYKKFHNFIVSLEDMIGDIEQSSGITCSFTYDNEVSWDNLLGDIKINAYRIVQEALKNCIKHAESQRVTINFQPVGDNLQLTIADDGVGFDVNKGRKGIGLKNIISRTKKVKGTVDIDSKKGTGTTITVTIPARFIELNVMEQTQTANA